MLEFLQIFCAITHALTHVLIDLLARSFARSVSVRLTRKLNGFRSLLSFLSRSYDTHRDASNHHQAKDEKLVVGKPDIRKGAIAPWISVQHQVWMMKQIQHLRGPFQNSRWPLVIFVCEFITWHKVQGNSDKDELLRTYLIYWRFFVLIEMILPGALFKILQLCPWYD